jgi:cobalamin synthase
MPLGFGVTVTAMAVQTFINRRVPLAHQGRTFALQSTVKNGVSIIPLVTLGIAASLVGVDTVLIATPLLFFALAFVLLRLSLHFGGHTGQGRLDVLESFWGAPPPAAGR